MISKTKIRKRACKKRNPALVKTIKVAEKKNFLKLAKKLSAPTRQQSSINLEDLNKLEEKEIVVVGRVLGEGEIKKKIKIAALGFSDQARKKLEKSGCEIRTIEQLVLEKNFDEKKVKII